MVATIAITVVSLVKISDLPLGIMLDKFMVFDSPEERYFKDRAQFFPGWPGIGMYCGAACGSTPHCHAA